MRIELSCRINNNRLSTDAYSEIMGYIRKNNGKTIEVILQPKRSKRSEQQNKFYFGCVIPIIQNALKDLGHRLDKDEVHYFLREKFNYRELVNEVTGESVKIPQSTTALTKTEFGEYIERIAQWSAEFLNLVIPEPETQLQLIQ